MILFPRFGTACQAVATVSLAILPVLACGPSPSDDSSDAAEEARVLRQNGLYREAVALFEEALETGEYDPGVQLELAEAALLAAQSERSRSMRQKAAEALRFLEENPGELDLSPVGELWRRLGWEMSRDADSLQAFQAFENALAYEEMGTSFEDEWLFRGAFASRHIGQVADIPDSLVGTPAADSLVELAAEQYLVELDRVSLARTDLRADVLLAKARLLPMLDRPEDEVMVLTELDRLGQIDPGMRRRRMQLLLEIAWKDLEDAQPVMARERALEVWESDFMGEKVEAAVILGTLAEQAGDPEEALDWYRAACSVSPDLSTAMAQLAAARRDSLLYLIP
jgi:tetratricopeptide (TPR) repeat protein